MKNILVITLIIFIISCSSNRNNQDENLRRDLSVFFTTNLNDSSVILDSFLFKKIDQINEAIEETNSKHFRRYYNKTKTKRLVKLRKIINQEIDIKEINNMKLL